MRFVENLYQEGANWIIEFGGIELKGGRRNGRTNVYRLIWLEELVPQPEEFMEHCMNILLVRNVWASEYFAAENDVTIAADLLGGDTETVMRHYVDPLCKQATEAADRFVCEAKKRQKE